MEIPAAFRSVLPHRIIVASGAPYKYCRVCSCNTVLHRLSEKPWTCNYCGECPGLESADLDAMIEEFLARGGARRRPWIPLPVRKAVLERDGMVCRYCGCRVHMRKSGPCKLNFDHVIPYILGGPTTVENLAVCCRACNLDKKDRTVEVWLVEMEEMAEFDTRSGMRLAKIMANLAAADPAA